MGDGGYLVEVLTPRLDTEDLEKGLERFAEGYKFAIAAGHVVSIPDNPMGVPRFRTMEVIGELGLPVSPEGLLVHVNTFHTRDDLDRTVGEYLAAGIRKLLVVTGDGAERLAKLSPGDVGAAGESVTSADLLEYLSRAFPKSFTMGAAFNPYEPEGHEFGKVAAKARAGASFLVTQPVIGFDRNVARLAREFRGRVFVGAWMSTNTRLLSNCVGRELSIEGKYDPEENLTLLKTLYPENGLYLSMCGRLSRDKLFGRN